VAAFTVVPRYVLGDPGTPATSERLHLAVVGVGGRGFRLLEDFGFGSQNIVALCDVDAKYAAPAFAQYPKAGKSEDRNELQGLLSYMERAPVSLRRLTYLGDGRVHYQGTKCRIS
jgi:hypothetical protein